LSIFNTEKSYKDKLVRNLENKLLLRLQDKTELFLPQSPLGIADRIFKASNLPMMVDAQADK